jgi:hypothetical protein
MKTLLACGFALLSAAAIAQDKPLKQKTFASPEEAAAALVAATKAHDRKAQFAILGSGAKELLQSGDAVADKAAGARFVSLYEAANKLEKTGDKAVLAIGKDAWPFRSSRRARPGASTPRRARRNSSTAASAATS